MFILELTLEGKDFLVRHAAKIFSKIWVNCTVGQEKKTKHPYYFCNTNYRTEMTLVPIIKDYCLLLFDALKFFLLVLLHGGEGPQRNFNFFNANPQIS